ncbi:MAG: hypothetical protein RMK89_02495 [Armatimonadota bacterium]|nr:hypothetical protein [Armatimonadota bacterium]MDW8142311.1 hypothetical protein [Armatimonadota bacterium]
MLAANRTKPVMLTVFLLSFCGLSSEIALTRVFAVVLRYHFAFLAIAIALCGLGLGGYIAHWLRGRGERAFAWFIFGFALTMLFSVWFLVSILLPYFPTAFWLAGLVALLPFLFLGMTMALLFDRYSALSGYLYGADLAGAAIAAAGTIFVLDIFGGLNALVFIAGIVFLAAIAVVSQKTVLRLFGLILAAGCFAFSFANRDYRIFDLPPVRHARPEMVKPMLAELATGKSRIIATIWNSFSRTDAVQDEGVDELIHLYTDGEVPALMVRLRKGDLKDGEWLMGTLMGVPYALLTFPKAKGQPRRQINSVLALGSGGGVDVICSLIAGAKEVDAVDVNPAMKIFAEKFRDFNGGIYEKRGVKFYIAEARAFVKQTRKRYDLVVMALTQTATIGKAGLALVESYVHTKDACLDYWRVLSDRGMVALITQEPALALRWWLTCLEVVQEQTGKEPKDAALHLAWWELPQELWGTTPYRQIVIAARQPFSKEDAGLLLTITERWRIIPVFVPFVAADEPLREIARSEYTAEDVIADTLWRYQINVRPVTDDSPFFVDLSPTVPEVMWQFVISAIVVVLAFGILAGLMETKRRSSRVFTLRTFWSPTLYVALLGVGFMLVEIGLMQRTMLLLGSPTHTLALFVGALLLGGALGSTMTQRQSQEQLANWAMTACVVVAAATSLLGLFIAPFVNALHNLPLAIRAFSLFALTMALGIPMGMPFPSAMRLAPVLWAVSVAYLWGVNGVMSVVGSVSAVLIGKFAGYSKAIVFGAICYLIAAAVIRKCAPSGDSADIPFEQKGQES